MIPQNPSHDKHLPPLAPGPRAPTPGESVAVPRPKKNSIACQPCKQAKRKCSGPPSPCNACKGSDSECLFDESLDLRRKVAVRRSIAELEDSRNYYRDLLHALLASLRSPDPNTVDSLVSLIRSNASLPDIATLVADNAANLGDVNATESIRRGSSEDTPLQLPTRSFSDSHTHVTLEMLCDLPLFQVPAKPWTAVTDDNHLVSHLVSLYFTWDHPFSQVVDQDIFLAEMTKGDMGSGLCTPFLVNSILAMASAYSDFPKVFAIPGDMSTRGQHFFFEAERLWKAEEGKATLVNIQGVTLMCYALRYQGKERLSWLMLKQAVQLARDIGMFQAREHHDWEDVSSERGRAFAITAWGVSILNAQMSLEMGQTADIMLPVTRPFAKDSLDDGIMWSPYPRTNQIRCVEQPALLRYVIMELANLTEIIVDMESLLFDKAFDMAAPDLWSAALVIYSRIQTSLECLPDALSIDDKPLPLPQALFVRIKYHHGLISLFSHLIDYFGRVSPAWSGQARTTRLQSAKAIAGYLRAQRQCYGLKQIPCHMIDAVHSALLTLLVELSDVESKQAFVELCRSLAPFRQRVRRGEELIQKIIRVAMESEIKLPVETVEIFSIDPGPSPWGQSSTINSTLANS